LFGKEKGKLKKIGKVFKVEIFEGEKMYED